MAGENFGRFDGLVPIKQVLGWIHRGIGNVDFDADSVSTPMASGFLDGP